MWDKDRGMVPYAPRERSHLHNVIGDEMPPTLNHADGNIYESKSAFRAATRAAGYYEVGNDLLSHQSDQRTPIAERIPERRIDEVLKESFERHGLD